MFKTLETKEIQAEIVEKKSKFIANIFYVENIEEAEERIKETKKKYFDARHNCFAYRVATKEGIVERFSDDGEPSGTAGGPMLTTLNGQNLANIVVIVTRYFGGILLGVGGLIRAYTLALQEALNKVPLKNMDLGVSAKIEISYADLEKLKYYCKQKDIRIIEIQYLENVEVITEMLEEKYDELELKRNELNFVIKEINLIGKKYICI